MRTLPIETLHTNRNAFGNRNAIDLLVYWSINLLIYESFDWSVSQLVSWSVVIAHALHTNTLQIRCVTIVYALHICHALLDLNVDD